MKFWEFLHAVCEMSEEEWQSFKKAISKTEEDE